MNVDWKSLATLQGVSGIQQLRMQYKAQLVVTGAPASVDIKVYEDSHGRFSAVASHRPVKAPQAPPKPSLAARPVATPRALHAKGPVATQAPETPAIETYSTAEAALEATLKNLIQTATLSRAKTWDPDPVF